MPRIAVVQNGTDVARSSWAEVAECYQECARLISDDVTRVEVEFFADEAVAPMLASLDRSDFACVVFVSNALTSDAVAGAVLRYLARLHSYVAAGGGLVILHQWLDSLSPFLPDGYCPTLATRRSPAPDPAPLHRLARDDLIVHFPMVVPVERLRDGGHDRGPSWVYFKALDLPSLPKTLKAVLVKDDLDAVVVRTDDHVTERVVICTALLDWQYNVELLSNILRWAAFGSPRRLVRRGEDAAPTKYLHRWLSTDGSSTVSGASDLSSSFSRVDQWLLTDPESQVELVVVAPEHLAQVRDQPEALVFFERGGTMLATDASTDLPASRITAYVGAHAERLLARRLYAELRAVPGWNSVESAFDLRNIASAVVLLWADAPNRTPVAVSPSELAGRVPEILTRLSEPQHREDVSSSVALAQTVAALGAGDGLDLGLVEWMFDRPLARSFEVRLQVRALCAGWAGATEHGFLRAAHAALTETGTSLGSVSPLVRVLDSIALLHQIGRLSAEPDEVGNFGEIAATILDRFPPEPETGWISVEATADVVRGLVALLDLMPRELDPLAARLAEHAVIGADTLRRAMDRYERNLRGVAWLARLTHALVLADRYFPIGLQRLATLHWPDGGAEGTVQTVAERSLVEHLAVENKRLSDLQENTAAATAAKEVVLKEQRLPAAVGRTFATWVPTLLLVLGCLAGAWAVGYQTVWGLIANVAVLLTALLTLLSLLFAGLAKLHLLSVPATKFLAGLDRAADLLTSVGKVKGPARQTDA